MLKEPIRAGHVLNETGRELFDEFNASHGDSCCSCHINPPCDYCTAPGHPLGIEENDEYWDARKFPGLFNIYKNEKKIRVAIGASGNSRQRRTWRRKLIERGFIVKGYGA